MKVKIDENYYFEVDSNQFPLHFVQKQKKDPTKESDTTLGYYTSLERLIKAVIQHKASKSGVTLSLDEFLAKWKAYGDSLSERLAEHQTP